MLLAGYQASLEEKSGEGIADIIIRRKNPADNSTDVFVVEMKYDRNDTPDLTKTCKEAMAQIDNKRYADKFIATGGQVCKVALAIAGKMDVKSVFEVVPSIQQL